MKTNKEIRHIYLFVGMLMAAMPAMVSAQEDTPQEVAETEQSPEEIKIKLDDFFQIPPSSFTNEIGNGKDPFFPDSKRRKEQKAVVEIKEGEAPVLDLLNASRSVTLQGVNWNPNSPLALINGKTFREQETHSLNLFGKPVAIRCVKIRRTAVLIKFVDQDEYKVLELKKEVEF